jgi:alkyl sulfatase BDS1-like metallo-beta-lactamase superfamily hydrolase
MEHRKDASEFTKAANARLLDKLPFGDRRDFEAATRGLVAPLKNGGRVGGEDGAPPIWDLSRYEFAEGDAPDTVNPSLWRQVQIMKNGGLFDLGQGIFQVIGGDLSNITFIETENGVVTIDALMSAETAKAAMELYYEHRPNKPLIAAIITHSHGDHYGGIKALVSDEDLAAGKVKLIAPEGFTEEALSENVMAGNAMLRRGMYMYGSLLAPGPRGQASAGLGLATSHGSMTFAEPTDLITEPLQEMTIDGERFVFMLAPGTEAPAEMLIHLPERRALGAAEDATHTLHNLYTLRGAKVRDAKAWSFYLDKAIELFADETDVVFAQHHWPTYGQEEVRDFLEAQRDIYKYLHDQTLRYMNQGYTMLEIAEMVEPPDALGKRWENRGYYGSVNHDIKAIYAFYIGWFDGNPSNLHPYPPAEAGQRYVEAMGGAEAVIAKGREAFEAGDYRWVSELVNHLVFADPSNIEARELVADALEQLGYQAENGTWRNFYLTGAQELRVGVKGVPIANPQGADTVAAMPHDLLFDFLAVRLDGPRATAAGAEFGIALDFTDTDEHFLLKVKNGVLNHRSGKDGFDGDVTVTLTREILNGLLLAPAGGGSNGGTPDGLEIVGRRETLGEFLGMLDTFDPWFNIVEP